jgi:hypothetical protein
VTRDLAIEASTVHYLQNAMHDQLAGGGFASYDATVLRVSTPPGLRGRELTIFHERRPAPESPWRAADRALSFTVREDLLADETTLFDGALCDLRWR